MRVVLLVLWIGLSTGVAMAQTPAERNPEAVHISTTYGVPQLNGRLLLPGEGYDRLSVGPQLAQIDTAWRSYAGSFRIPGGKLETMAGWFARNPDLFRQVLAQSTRATPDQIEKIVRMPADDFARTARFAPNRLGFDEFDVRALTDTMRSTVASIRYQPKADRIPVTILLAANFGTYNFDREAFALGPYVNGQWFLDTYWAQNVGNERKPFRADLRSLRYPAENAQALARALEANTFGRNVYFVGLEGEVSPNGRNLEVFKAIFALDPALTQRFHERDYAAERAQEAAAKAAEQAAAREAERAAAQAAEQQVAAARQAEAEGFDRATLAQRFETAGLVLGAPPPSNLGATRYPKTGRTFPIPALEAFFHLDVPGGQVAFLTTDSTMAGNVVYISRVFENENVTGEALQQAVVAKLGAPIHVEGRRTLYWMSDQIPQDRMPACRLKVANTAVGNAMKLGGGWSRPPMPINPNQFKANCGLIANLNLFEKKYGAADTTYFNAELAKALDAQRATQAAAEAEAQAEIDF